MTTTYNPGDRVITKIKGQEIEVSVVKLSIDVEVKAPDGTVWWRAISKVRPVGVGGAAPIVEQPSAAATSVLPIATSEASPTDAPAPAAETPSLKRQKETRRRR